MIVGPKDKETIDLSRYSKRERELIEWMQRDKGRPLTREEINLSLEGARSDPRRRFGRVSIASPAQMIPRHFLSR